MNILVTDTVLYGIIGACVAYLLLMYIMQKIKGAGLEKRVKKARAAYEEAKQIQGKEKDKLIDHISMVYGVEQAHYVSMGKLWAGMPMNLLLVARGKASNIKQSVGVDSVTQTWMYTETDKNTGSSRKTLEVVLINNEVNNWNTIS